MTISEASAICYTWRECLDPLANWAVYPWIAQTLDIAQTLIPMEPDSEKLFALGRWLTQIAAAGLLTKSEFFRIRAFFGALV
jgi:hypothetical protein